MTTAWINIFFLIFKYFFSQCSSSRLEACEGLQFWPVYHEMPHPYIRSPALIDVRPRKEKRILFEHLSECLSSLWAWDESLTGTHNDIADKKLSISLSLNWTTTNGPVVIRASLFFVSYVNTGSFRNEALRLWRDSRPTIVEFT